MRRHDGSPDGEPVKDYYPCIVDEGLWQRARAGVIGRRAKGKKGAGSYDKRGFENPFTGLLKDARNNGSPYNVTVMQPGGGRGEKRRGKTHRILRNLAVEGHVPTVSFPYLVFEQAILKELAEIDTDEVIARAEQPFESLALAAEREQVTEQIERIKDNLLAGGDSVALADVVRQLEAKQRDLAEREREARRREAVPLTAAWRETKSLLVAMENAEDKNEFRLRLRAVFRREIDSIWLLIVPRGRTRLALVQVWFAGGQSYRTYLIIYRAPLGNHRRLAPARWACKSLAQPEGIKMGLPFNLYDLRTPEERRKHGRPAWLEEFCELTWQEEDREGYLADYPQEIIDWLLREHGHDIE
jgi:hypothetical protein